MEIVTAGAVAAMLLLALASVPVGVFVSWRIWKMMKHAEVQYERYVQNLRITNATIDTLLARMDEDEE